MDKNSNGSFLLWSFSFLVLASLLVSVVHLAVMEEVPSIDVYVKILSVLIGLVWLIKESYARIASRRQLNANGSVYIYVMDGAGAPVLSILLIEPSTGKIYCPDVLGQVRLPSRLIGHSVSIRRSVDACEIGMERVEKSGQKIYIDE